MNFEPSDMIWSHTTTLTICSALWDSARMARSDAETSFHRRWERVHTR